MGWLIASEDNLKSRHQRVLRFEPLLGTAAQLHRVVEPGVLEVGLVTEPFVEIPVEANGQLGGAAAPESRIGQAVSARHEDDVADVQSRNAAQQLPGSRTAKRTIGVERAQRDNGLAVGFSLLAGQK